jgi:GMP synthase (glutamine-hydrolysing)
MEKEMIVVLDFGGQYKQLIARRVRECSVYCEIHPYTIDIEKLKEMAPKGIILTGGPASVYKEDSPSYDAALFSLESRSWASATARSLWRISSAAGWKRRR